MGPKGLEEFVDLRQRAAGGALMCTDKQEYDILTDSRNNTHTRYTTALHATTREHATDLC